MGEERFMIVWTKGYFSTPPNSLYAALFTAQLSEMNETGKIPFLRIAGRKLSGKHARASLRAVSPKLAAPFLLGDSPSSPG